MPTQMVRYIPHGIDMSYFRPPSAEERRASRQRFGIEDDTFVCVQLGRVVAIKRPETLARACACLRNAGRKVVALYAGHCEPDAELALRQAIGGDSSGWLRLLGHQDAREVLWAADAKVLGSEREGFPQAIVEAMACGVVPLRTPTGGAEDQINHGVDGFIFAVADEVQLGAQLSALMDTPGLREEMQAAAADKAQQFSADRMVARTISVYAELSENAKPDPEILSREF